MMADLIQAWRSIRRSKGYAAAALLTLALGLGANAAIFSVVLGVLVRPLPFRDAGRLVWVGHAHRDQGVVAAFSSQDFDDLVKGSSGAFSSLADYGYFPGLVSGYNLTGAGEPLRIPTASVSGAFFTTLGIGAELGRALLPADDRLGANHVVVLSDRLWRGRFGHDRAVVGRKVTLDGEPFTVVGVMPPQLELPAREVGLWAPLSLVTDAQIPHLRGVRWLSVVGRLAPGVTQRAAAVQATAVLARLERQFPGSNEGWGTAALVPLHERIVGDVRPIFGVLFAAVGAVLLIVCVNLANLTLARAAGRGREMAIRAAIGATPARLARQLLVESLALALAGGALGLLLARWAVAGLSVAAADFLPRLVEIRLDGAVVMFTMALAVATALVFGLSPALRAAGPEMGEALQQGGRGGLAAGGVRRAGSAGRSGGGRGLLVMVETALATVLLLGAGLLLRSFWQLLNVDPGLRPANVLSLSITIPDAQADRRDGGAAYRVGILQRLRALPGVVAVGGAKILPLAGSGEGYSFTVAGVADPVRPGAGLSIVSSGYFRALGIPILRGRPFDERDDMGTVPPAAIVNQTLARQVWHGRDPLGQHLHFGKTEVTVVGVAGDVRHLGLAVPPAGAVYGTMYTFSRSAMRLFLRTSIRPFAVLAGARRAIWEVNREQPISEIATLDQLMADQVARPRLVSWLVGCFGALAALLAALGTYGVIAYGVRQRTQEIGVRMALGADRGRVVRLVVRQGLALALAGLGCGLLGGLAGARLLGGLLYGVGPADPATYAGVALLIAAAALAASYLPAREAARVDPMVAIKG